MRLSHFFIDRPRFAVVLSIFITLLGLGALAVLPVAQYPEVVPPTVQITASLPVRPQIQWRGRSRRPSNKR